MLEKLRCFIHRSIGKRFGQLGESQTTKYIHYSKTYKTMANNIKSFTALDFDLDISSHPMVQLIIKAQRKA